MKKSLIMFSSCIPFLLAGCSFTQTSPDVISDTDVLQTGVTSEITGVLTEATETSTPPSSGEQIVGKAITSVVQPGLQLITESLTIKNDEQGISKWAYQNNQSQIKDCTRLGEEGYVEYTCKEMRGYNHTYYAPELGIRVSYSPRAIDSSDLKGFWEKDPKFVVLSGNTLYASNHEESFIEYIKKDPTLSPDDIIKTIVTPENCKIQKESEDNLYQHKKSNSITYFLDGDSCQNESNGYAYTLYIFSPTEKNYYYRQAFLDGCAPGACSTLDGTQEFFVK
ncbi:MAG: hypothetical protein WCO66_01670 [Candidatus Absconditabacteria bacterium]